MGFFEKFKENKKVGILIIIVILLGLFLRFNDFGEGGAYHGDCDTYFSPALLWFYPHDYYPGLSGMGEPALGHFFIGLGCLASGEDFSGITEIKPNFYPGRQILYGKEIVNAEKYCIFPIYFFGLLFFITIIIFALILLDIYSASYFISFFAFYQPALQFSRIINVNIFAYFFSILGLLFLWKAYVSTKAGKKELIFFVLSSISFAAAFSSKLPSAAYMIFFTFLFLEKYKDETLFALNLLFENLGLKLLSKYKQIVNLKPLIKTGLLSLLAFVSVLFVTFEFNFMNIFKVIQSYQQWFREINAITFNPVFLYKAFLRFLYEINSLDMLIFFFSIYIFIKILLHKEKSKLEKFIIYQIFFLILLILTFQILSELQRAFAIFFFGLILLMSLTFSNNEYSTIRLLRFSKKTLFFIFMIVYISCSFCIAWSTLPYFGTGSPNKMLCLLTQNEDECKVKHYSDIKIVSNFLNPLLKEDETFLPTGFINYYLRQEDDIIWYLFWQKFTKQFNREPALEEYLKYYHPMNRIVRYVWLNPRSDSFPYDFPYDILQAYEPNYRIQIKGIDSVWVYDLQNLKKYQ